MIDQDQADVAHGLAELARGAGFEALVYDLHTGNTVVEMRDQVTGARLGRVYVSPGGEKVGAYDPDPYRTSGTLPSTGQDT